jgi:hypothetical protein
MICRCHFIEHKLLLISHFKVYEILVFTHNLHANKTLSLPPTKPRAYFPHHIGDIFTIFIKENSFRHNVCNNSTFTHSHFRKTCLLTKWELSDPISEEKHYAVNIISESRS